MMQKKWAVAAIALITAVLGVTMGGFSQQTEASAYISRIDGYVDLKAVGTETWVPLLEGYEPQKGDEIQTGPEGSTEIVLKDSSVVKIGPDSYVIIRELEYLEVYKSNVSLLELVEGKIRAWITPIRPDNAHFSIETENASVGVRGTDFGTVFDPDTLTTTIFGIESCVTVEFSGIPDAGTETVCEGSMMDITTGRGPGTVRNTDPDLLRRFLDDMNFSDGTGAVGPGDAGDPYIDRAFVNNRIDLEDAYEVIVNNSNLSPTGELEINGVAGDDSFPVATVEYSLDGGLSWNTAEGAENWRFSFIPEESRDYELMLRAINSRGTSSDPYDFGPWIIRFLDVSLEEVAKSFLDTFILYLETANLSGLEDLISEEYDGNAGGYYSKSELISESIEPFFDGTSSITVHYSLDRVIESSVVAVTTWNSTLDGFNDDGRTSWWIKGEDEYRLVHMEGDWLLGGSKAGIAPSLDMTYVDLNSPPCDHIVRVLLTVPNIPLNVSEVEVEIEAGSCDSEYRTVTRSYYKDFTGSNSGFGGEFAVEGVTNCTDPHLCGSESIMYDFSSPWMSGYFNDYGYDLSDTIDLP